jgi:hypothetical protein
MKLKDLLAATALMAGAAFGAAPVVSAEPQEWDIEKYDECMSATVRNPEVCCLTSGGVLSADREPCMAPAADAQIEEELPGRTLPPVPPDSNLPTLGEVPLQPIA